jgi:hypothetical protein
LRNGTKRRKTTRNGAEMVLNVAKHREMARNCSHFWPKLFCPQYVTISSTLICTYLHTYVGRYVILKN